MPQMDPMTVLQNRWYNGLVAGLLGDPTLFQIIQPSPPLPHTDSGLWTAENLIPPSSLTFNTCLVGGEHFFDEYAAVVSQLEFPQSQFQQDIGTSVYEAWTEYVGQLPQPPTPDELPELFSEWASIHAPTIAPVGTSDLTELALISTGRQALDPYLGSSALPTNFVGTFAQMLQTIQQSSGMQISFSSNTSSDVSNTWTHGTDANFYGLWAGSSSHSRLTRAFAQSHITITAQFKGFLVWDSVPGAWYDSSILNIAYSNQSTPPWPENANPSWTDVFGPEGSMQQLIASLVVVDGMNITVTSDVTYSNIDQQTIRIKTSAGLWPFFIPSSHGTVTNSVSFESTSGMQIDTTTQPGNPIVIGANVLGIARYLGHAG